MPKPKWPYGHKQKHEANARKGWERRKGGLGRSPTSSRHPRKTGKRVSIA